MTDRSLIICSTPLQMIIAEKIIQQSPTYKFDLLIIAKDYNSKFIYYYKRLRSLCIDTYYYHAKKDGPLAFIEFMTAIQLSDINKKYKSIFLSNIDRRRHQYIVSKSPKSTIYTFDDGTANIIPSSGLYKNGEPATLKSYLFWKLVKIKYNTKDLRNKSDLHYTIYKDAPNIIDQTHFINLLDADIIRSCEIKNSIRVFLGAPIKELGKGFELSYLQKVLENLNINYYYPHPRESIPTLDNVEVLTSEYIFEDFIIDFLKKNTDVEVIIYSFTSSAAINVSNLNRVSTYFIKNPFKEDTLKPFYQFVEKKLNIPVINV